MSEYQYYAFQAIDRPLGAADRQALRALSTRAEITATSFVNSYEWGDFKGDPAKLMDRWFDLHLYVANWGTRRLMMRLPERLVDPGVPDRFLGGVDCTTVRRSGDNLILDIVREDLEPEDDHDDGSGWMEALAPIRADVLGGDLRAFYLLWLTAAGSGALAPDTREPMPGIGPLTDALATFAAFLCLDRDLVAAAAERPAAPLTDGPSAPQDARRIIAAMTDAEKTGLLGRLSDGDPHVGAELRRIVRRRLQGGAGAAPAAPRSVGALRTRARAIRWARARALAAARAAERRRQAEEAERARRARLDAIALAGEGAWHTVETEIARRSSPGYDRAARLLSDLRTIAGERGTMPEFVRRVRAIRDRHARKERLIERLADLV